MMYKVLLFDFAGVLMRGIQPDGNVLINQELLTTLRPLKSEYDLCIYTSSYDLLHNPQVHSALTSLFRRIFFAKQLNWPKSEPESYLKIAQELGVEPASIFFVDDSPYNITAAQQAGVTAVLFQSNHELSEQLPFPPSVAVTTDFSE
jgi:FMN phosphatase YigB (HAD superfamily)